jgi:predicted MFS family arabinose efflux permease
MATVATQNLIEHQAPTTRARRVFPWIVFALTFGLLLSDYMSRQVLSAVFPFLKSEWALTDTQLGALTSVVALTVGLLAVPLSLLADRWGRVRAIVLMAAVWSLATAASAVAAGYGELMLSRLFIGVGEAAYGSVGLAVVLSVFPAYRRAAFTGAFMAGGSFGSVIGVALGGAIAVQFGWRWAFGLMAVLGCLLVVLYRLLVSEDKLDRYKVSDVAVGEPVTTGARPRLRTLVNTPSVLCAYIGSGLQLFVAGSLFAWLPSYVGRAYGLAPDRAAGIAAMAILLMGVGMIVLGMVTDRLSRRVPIRKWTTAIVYSAVSLVFLGIGFSLPAGTAQLLLVAVGVFFAAGTSGPAGAMVANLTAEPLRATALGTLTLANNLLGLAAGPLVVGLLADATGLVTAMRFVPLAALAAVVFLYLGRLAYPLSLRRLQTGEVAR